MMKTMVKRRPELLAPAGDAERLEAALLFGADAVYLGGKLFNMRAATESFDDEALKSAVDKCHEKGVAVHLVANTLPRNDEVSALPAFFESAAKAGVDAFIIADIGVMRAAQKYAPGIDIHMSTQTGVVNYDTASALYDMGAKRIVMAREVSLKEIAEIRAKTPKDLEIECFVHGAMCMSFSGRCMLSNYLTGRDANRGDCAQPCRWKYHLVEEKRPGQYFEITDSEEGTYILNSQDMCMIEHIGELVDAGVDSFKIEGVIARVAAHSYASIDDIFAKAEEKGEKPFIIICDEIEDPHNLGAIIRTAECAGAHGVIIPKRRNATLSLTVAKTAAGALEYVPVARVANLAAAIDELKERGVWVYGTDMKGDMWCETDLTGAVALVIGSEGSGMGRLVREKCDFVLSLPMKGEINSLNASVAAGIIMYEVSRQRLAAKS